MWCTSCQQDVPGITTGVLPRPKCARCGKALASGGGSKPQLSYGGFLESGVDLMRLAAAQATSAALLPPVDWEIHDRLREVGVRLRQAPPPRPRIRREPLFEMPVGDATGGGRPVNDVVHTVADVAGKASAAEPEDPTSSFFWTAVAVMLAFLLGLGLIWPELFETLAARLR